MELETVLAEVNLTNAGKVTQQIPMNGMNREIQMGNGAKDDIEQVMQ